MLKLNPLIMFPHLEKVIPQIHPTSKMALDWWNSLDPGTRSKWFDEYYRKNKIGLNLTEITKLYKSQNGIKRKRI